MARILNFLIVIMELLAISKCIKERGFKNNFIFYTQISNLLALISSCLLVLFGQKYLIEVLRFLAESMLIMTFFVTAFILVPMSHDAKGLLFSGNGLFHHLIIPILSTISYFFAENRAPFGWFVLPSLVTLVYGLIMLYLNAKGKVEGPYPFFLVQKLGIRKTVIWMVCLMTAVTMFSTAVNYHTPRKTDLRFVYVHGISGWGSYDLIDEFFPYWGHSTGNIIRYMNNHGYDSYSASVDPSGSAWDRACELYAQLTGTRVDYGAVHSKEAGHERFGEDYTGRALMKNFDNSSVVLIGHSFGGVTVRLFSEILRNGSEEEKAATSEEELSEFFKGGNGTNLFAIVTLAAPTNGTTAYDLYEDDSFDPSSVEVSEEYLKKSELLSKSTKADNNDKADFDYASYDMHIDNALAINKKIHTFEDMYYFAYPCSSTVTDKDGSLTPDPEITEAIFMKTALYMSRYTGTTKGGFTIDETWQSNDGLVNEISARAPMGAPESIYEEGMSLTPGKWYVMPTYHGDHMSLQGGLTIRNNAKPFYLELAKMLAELDTAVTPYQE